MSCYGLHINAVVMQHTHVNKSVRLKIIFMPILSIKIAWLFKKTLYKTFAIRWRQNERDSVSNHQPHDRLFRRRHKKTSKRRVTGLFAGNSPGTGEFPAQMASYAENVSIWWRHHGCAGRPTGVIMFASGVLVANGTQQLELSYQIDGNYIGPPMLYILRCAQETNYVRKWEVTKLIIQSSLTIFWIVIFRLVTNFSRNFARRRDVIKWKHFPRYWPFVRGIHRPPMNSLHKGQWRGGLMFSLICAWINGWVNNGEAGDLRCHGAHYDVIVMISLICYMPSLANVMDWHRTGAKPLPSPVTPHCSEAYLHHQAWIITATS